MKTFRRIGRDEEQAVSVLQRALVRLLWKSVADNAQCTCATGDTCPECEAMAALGLGRWFGAPHAERQLQILSNGGAS